MTNTLDPNMLHMENGAIHSRNVLLSAACRWRVYSIYSELIVLFYLKASHVADSFMQP